MERKTLKDEVETLIRKGYLSKYKKAYWVKKPTELERTEEKSLIQEPNMHTNRIINIVVGGITFERNFNSSRNACALMLG